MKLNKYRKFNYSLNNDFQIIFDNTKHLFKDLKNKKIFLTGCTGLFGYWLLKSFTKANEELALNAKAYVLTRQKNFKKSLIHKLCADRSIIFCKGDIRNFKYPKTKFDYIIHGATTSALETFKGQNPTEKFDILASGTKNILNLAKLSKCKKILFLSSGAVYGKQPLNVKKIKENFNNKIENLSLSVLGQAKSVAELMVLIHSRKNEIDVKIARCFSFIGPLIPLKIHYAAGNFLNSVIKKKDIIIKSSGKSFRSYMYMSDLTIWLWYILFKGKKSNIYNVGSEEEIRIDKLAKNINSLTGNNSKIKIKIKKEKKDKITRYVPSTKKFRSKFKIKKPTNLNDAIIKTYKNIIENKSFY